MSCDKLIDLLNEDLEKARDLEVIAEVRTARMQKVGIVYHYGEDTAELVLTVGHWERSELYYNVGGFSEVTSDISKIVSLVRREARRIIDKEVFA